MSQRTFLEVFPLIRVRQSDTQLFFMTAYQTDERGASEVNFLLFFIKLSPESLGHIYRPSGSVPSLATPQPKLPSESVPHPLLCLHFIGCQGKRRKNVCLAPSLISVPCSARRRLLVAGPSRFL